MEGFSEGGSKDQILQMLMEAELQKFVDNTHQRGDRHIPAAMVASYPKSTRLCTIYLQDAVSLLEGGAVMECRQVSSHCDTAIARIGPERLPRRELDSFSMDYASVRAHRSYYLIALNPPL